MADIKWILVTYEIKTKMWVIFLPAFIFLVLQFLITLTKNTRDNYFYARYEINLNFQNVKKIFLRRYLKHTQFFLYVKSNIRCFFLYSSKNHYLALSQFSFNAESILSTENPQERSLNGINAKVKLLSGPLLQKRVLRSKPIFN